MAYNLTGAERAVDNAIRAYNKQIEKAYRELGYNHTVTRNLVATARSVFGSNSIKEKSITAKSYTLNMVDVTTGEVHAVPQISRGKDVIKRAVTQKLDKEIERLTKFKNTTGRKDLDKNNGKFNRLYSVTMAVNTAKEKARAFAMQNIPDAVKAAIASKKTIEEKEKVLRDYERSAVNDEAIQRQIIYDDLASEMFEAYHQTRNEFEEAGIKDYEDNEYFMRMQNFAYAYNQNTYNDDILIQAQQARDEFLLSTGYTSDELEMINALGSDDLLRGV